MKFLSLSFLMAFIAATVFAKGGDFATIDHDNLNSRLQAYHQIYVSVEVTDNLNDYLSSREEINRFLTDLKQSYALSIKRVNGVHTTSFCLSLNSTKYKNVIVKDISNELKLLPRSILTSIESKLIRPCK